MNSITHFVWSKMGDDGKEKLPVILARKEAEWQAGSIWWGVGNNMVRGFEEALAQCGGELPVVFSQQLSRPKKKSGSDKMRLWTRWIDQKGKRHDIPDHALVTSKGCARKYYALVCDSVDPIIAVRKQPFDDQLCINFPSGRKLDDRQNTALLFNLGGNHRGGRYRRGLMAILTSPHLVTLDKKTSRLLTDEEADQVANWNGRNYRALIRRIRGSTHC